ncbi:hypothetical protein TH53_12775 [Pedobacter lusitanus]|uniref:Uncharacterized protein n=1 Tax=Pedobacter lusitanus TaxID=1503925 RepID=A0A0D0GKT7_9SPHI|nr:hypothetical protein [Pedobacter lusitanus]KIO76790.1 hypothetical protein TH53_12775 [Pedobacter lusitanus]
MTFDNRKSFLELRIIWKDDDMFELKVTASNIDFSGTTQIYDQSEDISRFASTLTDFPKGDKTLFHEAGGKDSYAYFSMKYYPIGRSGLVGVEIKLESNVATEFRQEEKNKLKLEIIVEPSAIDNFQKELVHLAKTEEGCAILYGNDNRIDN